MDTRTEMRNNIEYTRSHLSGTINELSTNLNHKINLKQRIKDNPYGAVVAALAVGVFVATFPRSLFKSAIKAAPPIIGSYVTKKGLDYFFRRVK